MNLMTQATENIYKFGNTTLHLDRLNCKIRFFIGDNNRLNIRMERNVFDDIVDTYDFTVEDDDASPIIAFLVYYSYADYAMKNDKVYLTKDITKEKPKLPMVAINELYRQLIPIISVERDHIESLGRSDNVYNCLANLSKYDTSNSKMLSIKDIVENLVTKYVDFEDKLIYARKLMHNVKGGDTYALNKWNDFLNQLYIAQFYDSSKIDLNNLNIYYEFLTSKNYLSNPAIDCEEKIEELEVALLTPSKSAILVGPPGVGKTAIVEGLAYKISNGQIPPALQNKQILKINASSIVSGCKFVGMLEEKTEKIMQYLIENPDTILFIDEIHTVIGAGLGEHGNIDLANIMKPYIDRGQVKVIGATTDEEYDEYIKKDKAFNRRFQKVSISEPQKDTVYQIIEGAITKLEKTTKVKWNFDLDTSEMIINHIVKCSDEKHRIYNDKKYNPDLSLTILENSFARALLKGSDTISIDNIADAIRNNDSLYEGTRTNFSNQLLSKYQSITLSESTNFSKCKVLKFPTLK